MRQLQWLIPTSLMSIFLLSLVLAACQSAPGAAPTLIKARVSATPGFSRTPEPSATSPPKQRRGEPLSSSQGAVVTLSLGEHGGTAPSATTRPTMQPTATPTPDILTITIVYDNNPYDERLKAAWGFAALIEYQDQTVLFDTGADGPTLLGNMHILGIDPTSIDSVVLSHIHGDHTGGLSAMLATGVRPTVYLLPSFPASFKQQVRQVTSVVEVSPGQAVGKGIFTTGEMDGSIPEEALVIDVAQGLIVVTGCAHPGVEKMVARAKELLDKPVYLVLGGFHLRSKSEAQVAAIIADFRRMGVKKSRRVTVRAIEPSSYSRASTATISPGRASGA